MMGIAQRVGGMTKTMAGKLPNPVFLAMQTALLVSAATPLHGQREPSRPGGVFAALEGAWDGAGTLLGREGAFTMEWRSASDGFARLSFTNAFVGAGGVRTPVLSAEAVYLVRGDTAHGVWLDTRPQRITLEAVVSDSSLTTTWTAAAERGRTEYLVRGPDEVVVRDFVEADGGLRPFGEARYRRRDGRLP